MSKISTPLVVDSVSNSLANLMMDHIYTDDTDDLPKTKRFVFAIVKREMLKSLIALVKDFRKTAHESFQRGKEGD
jgi:hypothetical protein